MASHEQSALDFLIERNQLEDLFAYVEGHDVKSEKNNLTEKQMAVCTVSNK